MTTILRRGFVDVSEGQIHYRTAGEAGSRLPLVMLHPSPGSSKMLEPLIQRFAASRQVFAPDTLGNGDSSAPAADNPDLGYFANAHLRGLDALGLDRCDLYGGHTGAGIACEIAIRAPDRVRRVIFDGMSIYSDAERDDMLRNYAPELTADHSGMQIQWVWNFVRDAYLFWPWYRRDAAHVRDVGLPPPEVLHDKAVEVLKAYRTYHLSYRAAIAYDKVARLPSLTTPALVACAGNDMLIRYVDQVAALLPQAIHVLTPGLLTPAAAAETVAIMTEFLDAPA